MCCFQKIQQPAREPRDDAWRHDDRMRPYKVNCSPIHLQGRGPCPGRGIYKEMPRRQSPEREQSTDFTRLRPNYQLIHARW